jgi:hypothetical protein
MLKGLRNVVVLAAVAMAFSGCISLRALKPNSCVNETDKYNKETSIPPLRVPEGLDAPDTKSSLQIPVLNEPPPPPRGKKDPCLDEPPKFVEPKPSRPTAVPAA